MMEYIYLLFCLSIFTTIYLIFERYGHHFFYQLNRKSKSIEKMLEKDFISFPSKMISILLSAFFLAALYLILSADNLTLTMIFILALPLSFHIILKTYSRVRKKKIIEQIPFFLDLVESYLKAGFSIHQTIKKSVLKLSPPLKDEIKIVDGNIGMGLPAEEALKSLYDRTRSEETFITYITMSTCIKHGANIGEIVSKVKEAILEKRKMEKKIKAQTSQGKLQGLVLSIVPILLIFALDRVVPGFFYSLTTTPPGKAVILASSILTISGWILILHITRPRV